MTAKTGETTFTTPSDREFCAIRAFDAPRELVWEAYTEPRHLQNWMGGYEGWEWVACEVDLRPGGAYRFEWRNDEADTTHDLANQPWYSSYALTYGLDRGGEIDVVEAYGEIEVPMAEKFNTNFSARRTRSDGMLSP